MILALLSTSDKPFARFLDALSTLGASEPVIAISRTPLAERDYPHLRLEPESALATHVQEARVVVADGGEMARFALRSHRPVILVPRRKPLGESPDTREEELAKAAEKHGWANAIIDTELLADACNNPPTPSADYTDSTHRLRAAVQDALERIAARQ